MGIICEKLVIVQLVKNFLIYFFGNQRCSTETQQAATDPNSESHQSNPHVPGIVI